MNSHQRQEDDAIHPEQVRRVDLFVGIAVLLVIVLGSLTSVVTKKTLFPFDDFSMYSYLHTDDFHFPRMYGLPAPSDPSGAAEEIDISDQEFWGFQMHIGRKVIATNLLLRRPDIDSADMQTAMAFLRDLYNRRQQAAKHKGPPIVRLRMYNHYWKLKSDLSTLDAPYRRNMMAESSVLEQE